MTELRAGVALALSTQRSERHPSPAPKASVEEGAEPGGGDAGSYGDKTPTLSLVHTFPPEHLHFRVGACSSAEAGPESKAADRCCQWLDGALL